MGGQEIQRDQVRVGWFFPIWVYILSTWQFFVTFLGWLSDPFQLLSDLQLGDEKVTLNHLVGGGFISSTFHTDPWGDDLV